MGALDDGLRANPVVARYVREHEARLRKRVDPNITFKSTQASAAAASAAAIAAKHAKGPALVAKKFEDMQLAASVRCPWLSFFSFFCLPRQLCTKYFRPTNTSGRSSSVTKSPLSSRYAALAF